jgi:hypothetical protein
MGDISAAKLILPNVANDRRSNLVRRIENGSVEPFPTRAKDEG